LGKFIFLFTGGKERKIVFAKQPFIYFEVTSYPIHFARTTLVFSIITKIPFLLAFKF
jgi:hypothetical protein